MIFCGSLSVSLKCIFTHNFCSDIEPSQMAILLRIFQIDLGGTSVYPLAAPGVSASLYSDILTLHIVLELKLFFFPWWKGITRVVIFWM